MSIVKHFLKNDMQKRMKNVGDLGDDVTIEKMQRMMVEALRNKI
jgi:hypothetical protein